MTGLTVQNKHVTLVLLTGIASFVGIVSWMTVYLVTAVPGAKLVNGMICGFAEGSACLTFGYLLKWVSDVRGSIFMILLWGGCNILYKLMGAGEGGTLAMVVLWFAIFGIGSLVNAGYIMIEMRVPPEQLGASVVIIMTVGNLFFSITPNLAFLPQPYPLYIQLAGLLIIYICVVNLPPGGLYLPKVGVEVSRQELSELSVTNVEMISSINRSVN